MKIFRIRRQQKKCRPIQSDTMYRPAAHIQDDELMKTAGRGVSLRQAVRREQREYNRAEFVDPVSSRSFGRSHPVTKKATAFLRLIDEQMSVN